MIGRTTALIVIAVALLIQVVTGAAAPALWQCVCATEVPAVRGIDSCCRAEPRVAPPDPQPTAPRECHDCLVNPLPGAVIPSAVVVPSVATTVTLLASSVVITRISWPPVMRTADRQRYDRPPPDRLLRNLRTVILIC